MAPMAPTSTALAVAALLATAAMSAPAEAPLTQGVIFAWSTLVLDVLIVPPAHGPLLNDGGLFGGGGLGELSPTANTYLAAVRQVINDWALAIRVFGSPLLQQVVLNVAVLGHDVPSDRALFSPEIVGGPAENLVLVGAFGGLRAGERPCVMGATMFHFQSATYSDLYNLFGKALGHCLGLAEVAGAPHDVMASGYAHTVGSGVADLHCPSNLNVAGLESVFRGGGAPGTVDEREYRRLC